MVVTAQQSHVALALHVRPLRGQSDHRHGSQGPLPPDFPGVTPLGEANLGAGAVGALGDGVSVEGEAILLDVNVAGAVVGAKSMLVGLELEISRDTKQWFENDTSCNT